MQVRILAVEDDPHIARLLDRELGRMGYVLQTVDSAAAAAAELRRAPPHLLLLDLGLPDRDGADFLRDLRAAGDTLPETPGALWVVKPDDGAGADGLQLVPGWRLAATRLAADPGRLVAQPWLDGEAASLSVQCRDGRATLLAVNRQRVKVSPKGVSLAGLEVNALPDPGGRLAALADQVCRAIPGLDGYVGIDLLLGEDEPVVVEVNPRLTTSYVALGRALGINVARRLLDAADEAPAATAGPVSLVLEGADD